MAQQALTSEQILSMLAAAPQDIATNTIDLPAAQLHAAPAPGEWSACEVLAHLRACADMWGSYIAKILAHDHPSLRAISPRAWINKTGYREQPFHDSLQAFTAQRNQLLTTLEALSPDAWLRSATITGAGKQLERTVLFYAHWLAEHERPHLKQIQQIANAQRGK